MVRTPSPQPSPLRGEGVRISRRRSQRLGRLLERGNTMDQKRYDIGLAKRKQVLGDAYVDPALQNVDDCTRDFQRILTAYDGGETCGSGTLNQRERSIPRL